VSRKNRLAPKASSAGTRRGIGTQPRAVVDVVIDSAARERGCVALLRGPKDEPNAAQGEVRRLGGLLPLADLECLTERRALGAAAAIAAPPLVERVRALLEGPTVLSPGTSWNRCPSSWDVGYGVAVSAEWAAAEPYRGLAQQSRQPAGGRSDTKVWQPEDASKRP
jgi:hypothetical protein